MGRVVAIANQKGGVGKTTTAVNLAASLAAAEQRVLLVDMDAQGNASQGVGCGQGTTTQGTYQLMLREASVDDVLRHADGAIAVGDDQVTGLHDGAADLDGGVGFAELDAALVHGLDDPAVPAGHRLLVELLVGVTGAAIGENALHAPSRPDHRVHRPRR